VIKSLTSLIGKAASETKALSEDAVRVLSHDDGIVSGLRQFFTKSAVPKETMEIISGLSGNIEEAGALIAKSSPELQKQVTQKVLARFGNKITNQMEQLKASRTLFEKSVITSGRQLQVMPQRIEELEQVVAKIEDPVVKSTKIAELNGMKDKMEELKAALETNQDKLNYVDGKLIPVVTEFHNKLETQGYSEAMDYIKQAEETMLQPSYGSEEAKGALLQELSKVQVFVDNMRVETAKYVPEAASELLKSSNLDSARSILKEYAHNKATMPESALNLWKSNHDNATMLNKIDNSLYGSKFKSLLAEIKETKTPRKFAGSFAGYSPQEIAQNIGVPGAVGVVAGSMGLFGLFGWLSGSGLTYVGSESERIMGKLDKLQTSGNSAVVSGSTRKALNTIKSAIDVLNEDLKGDIKKAINEDLDLLYKGSDSLNATINQWPALIAQSNNKQLANEIYNDILALLKKITEEIQSLIADLKQKQQGQQEQQNQQEQ
jgi:cob(I)alamin adenosyltransferase